MNDFEMLIDALVEGDDGAEEEVISLLESRDDLVIKMGGDRTALEYAVLFEQLLDNNNFYAHNGWGEGKLIGAPSIGKYQVSFIVQLPADFDRVPIKLMDDKYGSFGVKALKRLRSSYVLEITVPRNVLDDLAKENEKFIQDMI